MTPYMLANLLAETVPRIRSAARIKRWKLNTAIVFSSLATVWEYRGRRWRG
ncbi:hypothetical protein CCHR01_02236 [Colletotrichum chrysophilum]|uniref:Uncharacterized protein n=1 Tax=Colletotrichum chrysophilum TaxID=1836956 RepID=A0AAD9AV09_9PEZI|nr:hypothetical protein CCHR01_02236 [Colletotrichum chrysophilum]